MSDKLEIVALKMKTRSGKIEIKASKGNEGCVLYVTPLTILELLKVHIEDIIKFKNKSILEKQG